MESRLAAPSSVAPIARNKRAIRSCATALEARQEDHQDLFQRQFGGYFLGRKAAQKRQPDNNLFQSACKPPGLLLDTRHRTEQSPKWPSRSFPVLAAPVAQLDRASGFGPEGLGFESLRAYILHKAGFAGLTETRTARIIRWDTGHRLYPALWGPSCLSSLSFVALRTTCLFKSDTTRVLLSYPDLGLFRLVRNLPEALSVYLCNLLPGRRSKEMKPGNRAGG